MTLQNVDSDGTACHDAAEVAYEAGVPGDWTTSPPDVKAALDELASLRGEQHLVFFASAVGITFDETGIITLAVDVLTGNTTLTDAHDIILADASGGTFSIKLPGVTTVTGRVGRIYTIKKIDSSANAITINPGGFETLDGSLARVLSAQYDAIDIISDGAEWWIR